MALTIADIRKQRASNFAKINEALTKSTSGFQKDDEGFWKPERDKAGNAQATIRFLPAPPGEELPFVQIYHHAFQGPTGKWYIENCLSTIGQEDPVNEANRALYATGLESDKKIASTRKRKLNYISRILVIKDKKNPENEGKTFFFKYGKKIFEKIIEKGQPTFEDETPVDIFDPFEGADFKLRMKQVEGYPNYDSSSFGDSKPLGTDEEIVKLVNELPSLKAFIAPSKFKSYDDLKKKMHAVLNAKAAASTAEEVVDRMQEEPVKVVSKVTAPAAKPAKTEDDDEDVEAFFRSIATGDDA